MGLLLVVPICYAPEAAVAQPGLARRETVRADPATLQVTVSGKGEPIVFIPSRGRSIDDFDDLSKRLVEAGYQVILPQPRGIGGCTGPLEVTSTMEVWLISGTRKRGRTILDDQDCDLSRMLKAISGWNRIRQGFQMGKVGEAGPRCRMGIRGAGRCVHRKDVD